MTETECSAETGEMLRDEEVEDFGADDDMGDMDTSDPTALKSPLKSKHAGQ